MRIAILSAGDGWHVQDLLRAARTLGLAAQAIDFRKTYATVRARSVSEEKEGILAYAPGSDHFDLSHAERVLVRTMPPGSLEQVIFRMDVLHRLQAAGSPVLNPPRAVEICVDKYLATALLSEAGFDVPPTIVCQHADAALEAFTQLGGDVVVKPLFGSEGRGIVRVSDPELAWRTFRTLERTLAVLYLQKYVPHEGWDLRVFVLGGRVLAAMRRRANGDWRTNVAQGGTPEAVTPTEIETQLALRAAEVVGAPVCGVDLLPGRDGRMYVLEVNAVPGWRALAPATGVDVAAEMLNYLANEYCAT